MRWHGSAPFPPHGLGVGVGVLLFWHPGGDYVFASDGLGLTFLLAGPVAVTATALWAGQDAGRR